MSVITISGRRITQRGFEVIETSNGLKIQQSSAIGDYDDSGKRPGTSFLWVRKNGEAVHLDREDISMLVKVGQYWLETGRLYPEVGADDI